MAWCPREDLINSGNGLQQEEDTVPVRYLLGETGDAPGTWLLCQALAQHRAKIKSMALV